MTVPQIVRGEIKMKTKILFLSLLIFVFVIVFLLRQYGCHKGGKDDICTVNHP